MGSLLTQLSLRNRPDLPLLSVARERGVFVRTSDDDNHNVVPDDLTTYKVTQRGNLVINKMKAWQGSMGIAPVDGVVSPAYFVYDLAIDNLAYAHLLLRSKPYVAQYAAASDGVRVGQWDLVDARFRRIAVALPPIREQEAIVRYLAHAHRRLEEAIATKRKLIALHEEEAQVIIAELLTGGAGNAARSDGLRVIPSSWRYVSTGRICTISTGVEDSGNADPDGAYPFYVRGREVLRSNDYLFDAEAVLTPGDGQGGTGKVFHYYDGKFQAHQRVYVLKGFDEVMGRYFFWYMSTFFREHALSKSNTVTMESLRRPMIASFPVALPSIEEQANIVERVESLRAQVDRLVGVAKREIALLEEFRIRLTADVVTGQVDVRATAATLPDLDLEAALAVAGAVDDVVEDDANDDGMEDE